MELRMDQVEVVLQEEREEMEIIRLLEQAQKIMAASVAVVMEVSARVHMARAAAVALAISAAAVEVAEQRAMRAAAVEQAAQITFREHLLQPHKRAMERVVTRVAQQRRGV